MRLFTNIVPHRRVASEEWAGALAPMTRLLISLVFRERSFARPRYPPPTVTNQPSVRQKWVATGLPARHSLVAGKDLALQVEYGLVRAAQLAFEVTVNAIGTAAAKDHHHLRLGLPEGAAV